MVFVKVQATTNILTSETLLWKIATEMIFVIL